MIPHIHTPGTVVTIDDDQHWSTCTDRTCGRPIHQLLHNYDEDGAWKWTAWKRAPQPAGEVPAMGPGPMAPLN